MPSWIEKRTPGRSHVWGHLRPSFRVALHLERLRARQVCRASDMMMIPPSLVCRGMDTEHNFSTDVTLLESPMGVGHVIEVKFLDP